MKLRMGEPNMTNGEDSYDILDEDNRIVGHFYADYMDEITEGRDKTIEIALPEACGCEETSGEDWPDLTRVTCPRHRV
jgi:hypothetical protein